MTDALADIKALGYKWHGSGTVSERVLHEIDKRCREIGRIAHSAETGTGRTTLLFSQLSDHHLVFTKDDEGDGDSLQRVQSSPLLQDGTVEFVIGPTQRTLLSHEFASELDVVYLDGPHAYPFPDLEYWATYPHLRAGGLLIIDDVNIPTIGNMYEVLRADDMYDDLGVVSTTAFLRRTSAPGVDPFGEGFRAQGYNQSTRTSHLPPRARAIAVAKKLTPAPVKTAVKRRLNR